MNQPYPPEVRARWDTWKLVSHSFYGGYRRALPTLYHAEEEELTRRGFSGSRLRAVRVFAATGLWWNIFWKKDFPDPVDFFLGWAVNISLLLAVVVGVVFDPSIGAIAFIVVFVFAEPVGIALGVLCLFGWLSKVPLLLAIIVGVIFHWSAGAITFLWLFPFFLHGFPHD